MANSSVSNSYRLRQAVTEALTIGEIPDTGNWREDTRNYLTQVLPQQFPVYRSVWAASRERVDLERPGDFWAETPEGASRSGVRRAGHQFLIEADALRDDIDVAASITRRYQYGEPEIAFREPPKNPRLYSP